MSKVDHGSFPRALQEINPDEAVAYGATVQAAIVSGTGSIEFPVPSISMASSGGA